MTILKSNHVRVAQSNAGRRIALFLYEYECTHLRPYASRGQDHEGPPAPRHFLISHQNIMPSARVETQARSTFSREDIRLNGDLSILPIP